MIKGGGGDEVSSVWRRLKRKDAPTADYKTKPGSTALGLDAHLLPRSGISQFICFGHDS